MKNMMTLTSSAAASVINPSSNAYGAKMADESSSFAAQTSKGFWVPISTITYQSSLEKEDLKNAEFEL